MSLRSRRRGQRQSALEFWYNGNGSLTFDPQIRTTQSTTIIWQTSDGHQATTTGKVHDFSYTPASGGPYRCTVRVAGGLTSIYLIEINTDQVVGNLERVVIRLPNLTTLIIYINSGITGTLNGLVQAIRAKTAFTYLHIGYDTSLAGSLADLATLTALERLYAQGSGISPTGGVGGFAKINVLILSQNAWTQTQVDSVIISAWNARDTFVSSAITMSIGGTNAAPSGNLVAPVEGSDWHNDGAKWIPLTGNAMCYDLLNDVNSEGFHKWMSISTS